MQNMWVEFGCTSAAERLHLVWTRMYAPQTPSPNRGDNWWQLMAGCHVLHAGINVHKNTSILAIVLEEKGKVCLTGSHIVVLQAVPIIEVFSH